jgi:hypothetical protein
VTSYTVTGTATNNTFTGGLLKVYVLDGAQLAGSPATASSPPQTAAYNCSITTTTTGSFVYGIANNETASTTFAASSGTTITDQASVNAGGAQAAAFHTTSATGTPGATTVGSSTAFAGNYGVVALEVLANGTQSIDASSPAVVSSTTLTSFTTASFTPPGSNILVAVLVACGNGSANVCVGTVSSSPTLTWTEQIKINSTVGAANSYNGVWTAVVPAASTAGPAVGLQSVARVPAIIVSNSGWRGAQHSR